MIELWTAAVEVQYPSYSIITARWQQSQQNAGTPGHRQLQNSGGGRRQPRSEPAAGRGGRRRPARCATPRRRSHIGASRKPPPPISPPPPLHNTRQPAGPDQQSTEIRPDQKLPSRSGVIPVNRSPARPPGRPRRQRRGVPVAD